MNMSISDKSGPADRRTAGPLDLSEVKEVRPYVDFGALHIPSQDAVQLRLEVEDGTTRVVAVTLDALGSTLQLQAFAAPKTNGIWHEIRTQMIESLQAQGATVEERIGSLGPELVAKVPIMDDSGAQSGFRLARFVGVDGPR